MAQNGTTNTGKLRAGAESRKAQIGLADSTNFRQGSISQPAKRTVSRTLSFCRLTPDKTKFRILETRSDLRSGANLTSPLKRKEKEHDLSH